MKLPVETEEEFLALAKYTNMKTRCSNCGASLFRHHKDWNLCDPCHDQQKAADDAARRLAGDPTVRTVTGRLSSSANLQNLPRTKK